jgi:hypothetical protein
MVALVPNLSEHYCKSAALLIQLHVLMRDGNSETDEADAIRDQLDAPWKHLSEDETARIRNLSADLASLEPDSPFHHPENGGIMRSDIADQIKSARHTNEYEKILSVLRNHSEDISADHAAFLRGWCYEQLGEPEVAKLFYSYAVRLDEKNDLYAVFAASA